MWTRPWRILRFVASLAERSATRFLGLNTAVKPSRSSSTVSSTVSHWSAVFANNSAAISATSFFFDTANTRYDDRNFDTDIRRDCYSGHGRALKTTHSTFLVRQSNGWVGFVGNSHQYNNTICWDVDTLIHTNPIEDWIIKATSCNVDLNILEFMAYAWTHGLPLLVKSIHG